MVWGAIAAVASSQLIGAVWYSRYFLGTLWLRTTFPAAGSSRKDSPTAQQAGPAYAMALVSSAGVALLLNLILVTFFRVKTVVDAVKFAALLCGLMTLVDASHLAFSHRSLIAFIIDHLYDLASLLAMAACLFYFD